MSQSDVSPDSHLPSTPRHQALGVPVWINRVLALAVWGVASSVLAQPSSPSTTPPPQAKAPDAAAQAAPAPASAPKQAGVALTDLNPNAPGRYTVKAGDTLWSIANVFLLAPWHWPELWGMNKTQIRNPHRIFPGQVLVLDTSGGRARLGYEGGIPTVKVSPKIRVEALSEASVPPVPMHLVRPFLVEALIVDEKAFAVAPRIVAAQEGRVMLTRGDRGYARAHYGIRGEDGLTMNPGDPVRFGVYRNALPLKDPNTGEILGYDAQYLGRAQLIRPERLEPVAPPKQRYWWDKFWRPTSEFGEDMIFEFPTGEYAQDHRPISDQSVHTSAHNEARAGDGNLWLSDTDMRVKERTYVQLHPATVDILSAKEDIRPGDRLVAEPVENLMTFIPHVPDKPQEGQIIRIYGDAVVYAGQNQVVVINRGEKDGLEPGHVLQIWRDGMLAQDKTDPARPFVRLPKERNGFMMVFRTFDKLSYALVLQITDAVKAGDRFTNP